VKRDVFSPVPNEPLLVADGVRVWFDTSRGVLRAVDGVSLRVDEGRTLGIVGESGSGKSVLVRSLLNLITSRDVMEDGSVRLRGRELRGRPAKEMAHIWGPEVGVVFQDPMTSLNPTLKVGEQLSESLWYHLGLRRGELWRTALELLESVGIPDAGRRLGDYPHQMSGGMRQRVTIAIALACSPQLLIADEPTTALDVTVQKQILDLLRRQQRERSMGMILVSHDLGVVAGRTDDLAVMYAGELVERGPTRAVFHRYRHPYTEALLHSIPRMSDDAHRRLHVIPGRPPDLVDLPTGCRFAARCRYAQPSCLTDRPALTDRGEHDYACFYPVGSRQGADALAKNLAAGVNAAGAPVEADGIPVGRTEALA
jgi:peptide/nickel transport system ATP-binding protein